MSDLSIYKCPAGTTPPPSAGSPCLAPRDNTLILPNTKWTETPFGSADADYPWKPLGNKSKLKTYFDYKHPYKTDDFNNRIALETRNTKCPAWMVDYGASNSGYEVDEVAVDSTKPYLLSVGGRSVRMLTAVSDTNYKVWFKPKAYDASGAQIGFETIDYNNIATVNDVANVSIPITVVPVAQALEPTQFLFEFRVWPEGQNTFSSTFALAQKPRLSSCNFYTHQSGTSCDVDFCYRFKPGTKKVNYQIVVTNPDDIVIMSRDRIEEIDGSQFANY